MARAAASTSKTAAKITCGGPGCRKRFVPKTARAAFCSPSCSQRARRGTKKPGAPKTADSGRATAPRPEPAVDDQAEPAAPKRKTAPARSTAAADSHELVMALRKELETANALDSFEGQLALELARRLVTPGEGASSLADKVRAARTAALAQANPAGPTAGPAPAEDDEVTKQRKAREAKAAAAAAAAGEV